MVNALVNRSTSVSGLLSVSGFTCDYGSATVLRDLGLTVLLVEQKIGFAREIGHHYYVLDRGTVAASGRMAELDDAVIRRHLEVA